MIQQRPQSKKKTMVLLAIMLVMVGGMLLMLFGSSSSPSNSFIPAESGSTLMTISAPTRFDDNLFRNQLFSQLVPQGGVLPINPTRVGRANPFVPVVSQKPK